MTIPFTLGYCRVAIEHWYFDDRNLGSERNEATVWSYDHIKDLSK